MNSKTASMFVLLLLVALTGCVPLEYAPAYELQQGYAAPPPVQRVYVIPAPVYYTSPPVLYWGWSSRCCPPGRRGRHR